MKQLIFTLVFLGYCCGSCLGQATNAASLLKDAPSIDGAHYRCDLMVRTVNSLRHLGKEQALAVLRNHLRENDRYAEPDQWTKVLIVCRLLFVNTNGWNRPRLGQPEPEVDLKVAGQFPLFPMAPSDGVPFLLIQGYNTAGFTSDTADKCVELCEGFPLIPADMPEQGYENAAEDLIKSEMFHHLYLKPESEKKAETMILEQSSSVPHRDEIETESTIEIKVSDHLKSP